MELRMFIEYCSTTTVIVALTSILTFFYLFNASKRPKNYPPGPVGLPFVGYLPFLGNNAAETIRKMKPKYGSVVSVQMGSENWIILNDHRTIHEAYVKQSDKFSDRPANFMFNLWAYGCGMLCLEFRSEYKTLKKFGFSTMRGLGVNKIGIEKYVIKEASFLVENLTKVSLATANIISRFTIGSRFSYDDDRLNKMLDIIADTFAETNTAKIFGTLAVLPSLRYIPPFYKGLKNIIHLRETFRNILKDFVDEHAKTFDENNIRDVIDAFLREMKAKDVNDQVFYTNQLLRHIQDLFEAGTGTTATAIIWCILGFANYPEYQEKLFSEIKKVIGTNEAPQMKHREKLHYTNAFIQEIFRHRTLSPLGIFHNTSEEATLTGYTIPKNTTVTANVWSVHYDPDLFKNPTKFHPERFLDKDGVFVEPKHMIEFSIGPRHCYGKQIAQVEMFIFITSIVQKLKVVPDKSKHVPAFDTGACNNLTYSPLAFEVEFEKR